MGIILACLSPPRRNFPRRGSAVSAARSRSRPPGSHRRRRRPSRRAATGTCLWSAARSRISRLFSPSALRSSGSAGAATATTTPPAVRTAAAPSRQGFRRLWRVLKQLFYEVTGALFGILAFAWLNTSFRAWTTRDVAHWLIAIPLSVAALFVFFAVTSFRRARKL